MATHPVDLGGADTRAFDPRCCNTMQYFLQGGEAALVELSQASGCTASLLAHRLADDTMVADGAATSRPCLASTTGRHQRPQG